MASLDDADLYLKLSAIESEVRIVEAQRRLLALRLQAGGLIGGAWVRPCAFCSRAGTRPGKVAVSDGWSVRWIPAMSGWPSSPLPALTSAAITSCTASQRRFPAGAAWPCWTDPGTDAFWSSGSKVSPLKLSGGVPTRRSSSGRPAWPPRVSSW